MFYLFFGNGQFNYLVHVGDIVKGKAVQVFLFDFLDVLFIVFAKYYILYPGPFCR